MKTLGIIVVAAGSAFVALATAAFLYILFWKSRAPLAIAIGAVIGIFAFVGVLRSERAR